MQDPGVPGPSSDRASGFRIQAPVPSPNAGVRRLTGRAFALDLDAVRRSVDRENKGSVFLSSVRPVVVTTCLLLALFVALGGDRRGLPVSAPPSDSSPPYYAAAPDSVAPSPGSPIFPVFPVPAGQPILGSQGDSVSPGHSAPAPLTADSTLAALTIETRSLRESVADLKEAVVEARRAPTPQPAATVLPIVVQIPAPSEAFHPSPSAQRPRDPSVPLAGAGQGDLRPVLRELERLNDRLAQLAQRPRSEATPPRESALLRGAGQGLGTDVGSIVVSGSGRVESRQDSAVGLATLTRLVTGLTRRVEQLERSRASQPR